MNNPIPLQKKLILASNSPRRKQLLSEAGFSFHTHSVKVSEFLDKNLNLDDAVKGIARQKAKAAFEDLKLTESQPFLILSSDTLVVHNETVYGKPENNLQAVEFLGRLSGQTHEVKTSICMIDDTGKIALDIESSFVTFKNLTQKEILDYVQTGEPMDKAGAYGIQGLGGTFISHLNGNLDNVMGLSITLVQRMLENNGWSVYKR